jgi:hypothetical protein
VHPYGFWITLPKNHFTENFGPKCHLTETPFDRTPFDRMPFDKKFILPNRRFNRRPFDRKFILPKKVIWPKKKLSKGRLAENIWKMVI